MNVGIAVISYRKKVDLKNYSRSLLDVIMTKLTCFRISEQGVHKVFRKFKKFITKPVDKMSYTDLFYINQFLLKFLVKLKFCVSD